MLIKQENVKKFLGDSGGERIFTAGSRPVDVFRIVLKSRNSPYPNGPDTSICLIIDYYEQFAIQ